MLAAGCVCRVQDLQMGSVLSRRMEFDRSTGSFHEVVNELVDSDTTKLSCHQFPETLTGFQLAYILRGVGFQEIAPK